MLGDDDEHTAACFREIDGHEYWDSDPLPGVEDDLDLT
jgi:hypothetical protein